MQIETIASVYRLRLDYGSYAFAANSADYDQCIDLAVECAERNLKYFQTLQITNRAQLTPMAKDNNNANPDGVFGPDVTKGDSMASGKFPSDKTGSPQDVIPPKSRTSDSVGEDFDKHCESCS